MVIPVSYIYVSTSWSIHVSYIYVSTSWSIHVSYIYVSTSWSIHVSYIYVSTSWSIPVLLICVYIWYVFPMLLNIYFMYNYKVCVSCMYCYVYVGLIAMSFRTAKLNWVWVVYRIYIWPMHCFTVFDVIFFHCLICSCAGFTKKKYKSTCVSGQHLLGHAYTYFYMNRSTGTCVTILCSTLCL